MKRYTTMALAATLLSAAGLIAAGSPASAAGIGGRVSGSDETRAGNNVAGSSQAGIEVDCGYVPARSAWMAELGSFLGDGVQIYSGPGEKCQKLGIGNISDDVVYYCYMRGIDGTATWTFLADDTIGVRGWAPDAYLAGQEWRPDFVGGSAYRCDR